MKIIKTISISKEDGDKRLVDFLLGYNDLSYTKSALKKLFRKSLILVNSKTVNTNSLIHEEDLVEIFEGENKVPKTNIKLNIIFEDDYMAVIYKEAGIVVSGNKHHTIANALEENLKASSQEDKLEKAIPVHRLDYPTSGLLIVAKTKKASNKLFEMFEKKTIEKTYLAVTAGKMQSQGEISLEIDSKKAHTIYKVIESVESPKFEYLNLVKLSPSTGRRHQLRKHLKSIGHPILGDKEYADESLDIKKGLFLHAYKLEFKHPINNKNLSLSANSPAKFKRIFGNASM